MGGEIIAAIFSSVIGAGASSINASKQRAAQKEAEQQRAAEAEKARLETERIAKETRPEGEALQGIDFGSGQGSDLSNTNDFLVPKGKVSALGSGTTSGLGFGG